MGASDWLGIHSLSSQAGGTVAKVGGDAGDLMACSEPLFHLLTPNSGLVDCCICIVERPVHGEAIG